MATRGQDGIWRTENGSAPILLYYFLHPDIASDIRALMQRATSLWEDVIDLRFEEAFDEAASQLVLSSNDTLGDGVLTVASVVLTGAGQLLLEFTKKFFYLREHDIENDTHRLGSLTYLIGRLIGLPDVPNRFGSDTSSIMLADHSYGAWSAGRIPALSETDIATAQSMYGAKSGEKAAGKRHPEIHLEIHAHYCRTRFHVPEMSVGLNAG
jgi:hypothetical protein